MSHCIRRFVNLIYLSKDLKGCGGECIVKRKFFV